jgi:myo-inositol-1(or 4)-monophosphatase
VHTVLVDTAAQACRTAWRAAKIANRPATAKGSLHDVVTESDALIEKAVTATLTSRFPDSAVSGEETGTSGGGGGIRWSVDPIDGTHNFSRGMGLFAMSVGVSVADVLVGGVVFDPTRDEMFTASDGVLRLNGVPVSPASWRDPLPVVLTDIPTAGQSDPAEWDILEGLNRTMDVRRIGSSALALAYVACGRADLAANADIYEWDVAGGRALVAAAGGGFTGVPGEPGTASRTGFAAWGPSFAAEGRWLAEQLRQIAHLSERRHVPGK